MAAVLYSAVTVSLPVVVQRGMLLSIIYSFSKVRVHITFQSPVQSDRYSPVCTRAHAHMLSSFHNALCNDRQAVKTQTQTQTLFSFKLQYTFMKSCHVLCFLYALPHFVALLVCEGLLD